jgi:hypothetical protein
MSDESIATQIERLVAEEHDLRRREQVDSRDESALDDDRERLHRVEVELDRCWDLLRQRRGIRGAGGDPDNAEVRDAGTVEGYLQYRRAAPPTEFRRSPPPETVGAAGPIANRCLAVRTTARSPPRRDATYSTVLGERLLKA